MQEALIRRAKTNEILSKSEQHRLAAIELAKRDPIFFFNQFCWTYDPRPEAKPNHFPFITYPFQDEYILELEEAFKRGRDLLTDKSRDMGVSWMMLTWITWNWWKDEPFNALIGSEKEQKCDNFDVDSLFGKIDYQLRRLPKWLLPVGFDISTHRTFKKIVKPGSNNSIIGDSANRDFSRQGRYSIIMLDEFGFWNFADSVWTATADASNVRLPVSTPNGMNNKFAELRFSNQIKVATLHWNKHPLKDQAWYEREKARRTAREVAQELDLDYEASGTERVFTLKTNKTLRDNVVIDPFHPPKGWAFRGGLDYGTRNKTAFHVFAKDYDDNEYCVWEWRRNMEDLRELNFHGSMTRAIAEMLLKECPYYDLIDHIRADPSLWVKSQNSPDGMTDIISQIRDELKRVREETKNPEKPERKLIGFLEGATSDIACIQLINTFWAEVSNPRFKVFKSCPGLVQELEDLMWEDWSEAQQNKRNIKEKIMDKNNHSFDSTKYCIMSRHKAPQKEPSGPPIKGSAAWFLEKHRSDKRDRKRA